MSKLIIKSQAKTPIIVESSIGGYSAQPSDIQLMMYDDGLYIIANPYIIKPGCTIKFARYTKSKSRYKIEHLNKNYYRTKKGWIVPKFTNNDGTQDDLLKLSLVDVTESFKYFGTIGKQIYEVVVDTKYFSDELIIDILCLNIYVSENEGSIINFQDKKLGIRLFDSNNKPMTDWLPFSVRYNTDTGNYNLSRWI